MRPKRNQILAYLQESALAAVDDAGFAAIVEAFPECSERWLRAVVRDSGLPLSPMVEGVRQSDSESLERTLLALTHEYESSGAQRRKEIRGLVITAKTHAQWAARRRAEKLEMVLWLRTWLENPSVFPLWIDMRRRKLKSTDGI